MDKKKTKHRNWVEHKRNPENIPIAKKQQTEHLENKLVKLCSIYFDQIETLSEKRFGACIQRAMHFDIERGLGAGQIPHRRYLHSEWFIHWENTLWNKINARIDLVSDAFFKII